MKMKSFILPVVIVMLILSTPMNAGQTPMDGVSRNDTLESVGQELPLYIFLERQIRECETKSLGLILDGNFDIQNAISKFYSTLEQPIILREENINRTTAFSFQQWLRKTYIDNRVRDFVLVVENPDFVLKSVESAFLSDHRGHLAALPHVTKWLVVTWTRDQWEDIKRQQFKSLLDNVAVVQVDLNEEFSPSQKKLSGTLNVRDVTTFMWRKGRTRQPSTVSWACRDPERQCVLYPNRYENNGLNGRRLKAIAKSDFKHIVDTRRVSDPSSNKSLLIAAGGCLLDIFNFSSQLLNFTYDILEEELPLIADYEADWRTYVERVVAGKVDVGLSFWPLLYGTNEGVNLSYPIVFDEVVGVYRLPHRSAIYDSISFICPFPPLVYVFLILTLVFVSGLYATIVNVYYHSEWNDLLRRTVCDAERPSNVPTLYDKTDNTSHVSIKLLLSYLRIISIFFTAILNQSYLPRPRQTSSRLVVAAWAIGLVFYNAMFSSHFTAEMVIQQKTVPIRTFKELLEQTDYTCITFEGEIAKHVLENAKTGTTLARLRSRTEYIKNVYDDSFSIDPPNNVLATLRNKVVFLYYKSRIEMWLWDHGRAMDYVVMSDDPLVKADLSIIFPGDSALTRLLSSFIASMHESGFFKELTKVWFAPRSTTLMAAKKYNNNNTDNVVHIHDIFWLSVTCLSCSVLSILVLAVENIVTRVIK